MDLGILSSPVLYVMPPSFLVLSAYLLPQGGCDPSEQFKRAKNQPTALLRFGAAVNGVNGRGRTALHDATWHGRDRWAWLLCLRGQLGRCVNPMGESFWECPCIVQQSKHWYITCFVVLQGHYCCATPWQ